MQHIDQDDPNFEWILTADGRRARVLRDRHLLRTKMTAMDHRSDSRPRITDGTFNPLGLNKPGQRVFAGRQRDMSFYDDYDRRVGQLWQQHGATGATIGSREGDVCTVRQGGVGVGGPGTMQYVDGELVCVPNRRSDARDAQKSHQAIMDAEYAKYEEDLRNAYRSDGRKTLVRDPRGREQAEWVTTKEDDDEENGNGRRR